MKNETVTLDYKNKSIAEIVKEMCSLADIFYASARKAMCVRGGFIATNNKEFIEKMKEWLPVYEGFSTYGEKPIKELGAMAVGPRTGKNSFSKKSIFKIAYRLRSR